MIVSHWLAWSALALSAVSLIVAVIALRMVRRTRAELGGSQEFPRQDQYAIIVNPSKPGTTQLRGQIRNYFARSGLPAPLFIDTTADDPGEGQARAAVAQGATVVVAAGGDGTVRAVASALANTDTVMGLIPMGTGNLLARNIDIDVANIAAALDILTSPATRSIDIGYLRIVEGVEGPGGDHSQGDSHDGDSDRDDHSADHGDAGSGNTTTASAERPHVFLVIGGIGFDAAMVGDTSATLKKRVGWLAYFIGGIKHLHARRPRMTLILDDGKPTPITLRTLLIGNCGKLPGGLQLLPDAVIDDGVLDIAAIDTRGSIAGWVQLFGEVILQGMGLRNNSTRKIGRIDHTTARRLSIEVMDGVQPVQVDGDILGEASKIEAWVAPRALKIRAPRAS